MRLHKSQNTSRMSHDTIDNLQRSQDHYQVEGTTQPVVTTASTLQQVQLLPTVVKVRPGGYFQAGHRPQPSEPPPLYKLSLLVGALSPVNHIGLYQGWKQTSIHPLVINTTVHSTTSLFFSNHWQNYTYNFGTQTLLTKLRTDQSKPCPYQTSSMTTEYLLQACPRHNHLSHMFCPLKTPVANKFSKT